MTDDNSNDAAVETRQEEVAGPIEDVGVEVEAISLMPTDKIIGNLRGQYGQWVPVEGEYRKRLHRLLGAIYEAIPVFELDPIKRSELEAIVRKDDAVLKVTSFKIGEVDALDLLLVSVLSHKRETSATRSQWRSALLRAGFKKVEHKAAAFEQWIHKMGGMIKAGKDIDEPEDQKAPNVSNGGDSFPIKPGKFSMDAYLDGLSTKPSDAKLEVDLDRKVDLYRGLGILLVYTSPDDPEGPVQLVKKIGDESVVKRVAQEVASGNFRDLTAEEQKEELHKRRLWAINKVALILAGRLHGKFDFKTLRAFTAALKGIRANDSHAQAYFRGKAGVVYSGIPMTDLWTMEIAHPEYLDVDPGRYFEGGRPNALIPYDVTAYGTPDGDAAIKEYISANTEPWRVKPGHAANA